MSSVHLLVALGALVLANYDVQATTSRTHSSASWSTPAECARECQTGEEPKTCYYQFTLEIYVTGGRACELCSPNATNTFTAGCHCVLADGVEKGILSANRMIPGPSIEVCEGDNVVVDVVNHMEGMETALHWHGILQKDTQYYDGTPFITQCPIGETDTFRYQWKASKSGTYFWHSHAGFQKLNGLFGSIIIREPCGENCLYDFDLHEHVIQINDWMHQYAEEHFPGRMNYLSGQDPDTILVNGKGQSISPYTNNKTEMPLEVFKVQAGKRYRFRLINSFATCCPALFSIQGHNLTVIATDGEPVQPKSVNSIVSHSGERYDFVIETNQALTAYWIQIKGLGPCETLQTQQLAVLTYDENVEKPIVSEPSYEDNVQTGVVLNPLDNECSGTDPTSVCVTDLVNARTVDSSICDGMPTFQYNASFRFQEYTPQELFVPGRYDKFFVEDGLLRSSAIDDISYNHAPSPLLTQRADIDPQLLCNETTKPQSCEGSSLCSCIHVVEVPYQSLVELVIVDETGEDETHSFHLHGYSFQVVAMGRLPEEEKVTVEKVYKLDSQGLIKRCANNAPPGKDTIAVPTNGYVIVRFVADNPGYWFFHCHILFHLASGMNLVFHVQGDLPPVPENFPTCGSFTPAVNAKHKIEL